MSGKPGSNHRPVESALLRAAREIERRHETIDTADAASEWFTARMIADQTGRPATTVERELKRMVLAGDMRSAKKRVRYGDRVVQSTVYRWPE